jgi:hypothetical protein
MNTGRGMHSKVMHSKVDNGRKFDSVASQVQKLQANTDGQSPDTKLVTGDRLDAAALKAMDALNQATVTGRVGSSNSSKRVSVKSPGKRRGKQALERDETESVISSVSTHRSAKSIGSLSSWFSGKMGNTSSSKNPPGGGITAENLAILNSMNDEERAAEIRKEEGFKSPKRRESLRRNKTPDDRKDDKPWWPKLF